MNLCKLEKVLAGCVLALFLSISFALCAPQAGAQELVAARSAIYIAAASPDTMIVQSAPALGAGLGGRASDLPSAYLFWSEDGATFDIGRYFALADLETMFPIPANSSLTIPAPPAIKVTHGATVRWEHWIFVNSTTVTDTVFVLPLDR